MNSVHIPEDADDDPDALLAEFARRGNRSAIIEEVYRRANGHPSGYAIAEDNGIDPENIEAVADAAWREYRDAGDIPRGERMLLLSMSYDHVADHIIQQVEGADDPRDTDE